MVVRRSVASGLFPTIPGEACKSVANGD